jgi:hypothetical protein
MDGSSDDVALDKDRIDAMIIRLSRIFLKIFILGWN